MEALFLLILIAFGIAFGFYMGADHGRAAEQLLVARVLAEYRNVDAASAVFVARILGSLKRDYRKAYLAVVDEVDQLERDLKKAL